jgi:hypothetical protein
MRIIRMMAAPQVGGNSYIADDHTPEGRAKPKKRLRNNRSNFKILINTNKVYKDSSPEIEPAKIKLRSAINEVFRRHINDITVFKVPGEGWETMLSIPKCDDVVEWGPKHGMIHAHIMLRYHHRTLLQISIPKIRELLNQYFVEGISYASYQLVKTGNNLDGMSQNYLLKGVNADSKPVNTSE